MQRTRRTARALIASGTALVLGAALGPAASLASSHREAPLIAGLPQLDNTDVYAFVSPDAPDTVTLIANWIPFEEPAGGPNFYPFADGAHYEIKIDNNHDAVEDITYRWTFSSEYVNEDTFLYNLGPVASLEDETLNFRQTYSLEVIRGEDSEMLIENGKVAPSHVGDASMPDYAALRDEAITEFSDGDGNGVTYAGQADDPFFLDLRVFDLLYGTDLSEVGTDTLSGFNTNTIAIQVPKELLAAEGDAETNPILGIWSTTSVQSMRVFNADGTQSLEGDYVQVSRLGNPLVNEVVVPVQFKDAFNASKPADDAQFLPKVEDPEVPKLLELIYKIPAPKGPRADLVSVFLTGVEGLNLPEGGTPSEVLRLNTSIAPAGEENPLGVIGGDTAGFPNGRRLGDDVVDIGLQVLAGELVDAPNDLADGVNENDVAFEDSFPYVALPHSGSGVSDREAAGSPGDSGEGSDGNNGTSTAPEGAVGAGAGGTAIGQPADTSLLMVSAAAIAALAGISMVTAGVLVRRRSSI